MHIYSIEPERDWSIHPAPLKKPWMSESANHYAYRCTPLSIANQLGWVITCPTDVKMEWDGNPGAWHIKFTFGDDSYSHRITNHAGQGFVAFGFPWTFRTEEKRALLVTGPCNRMKDGISPCTALVETDWLPFRFSMNWQMTRPGVVSFSKGEPVCQLIPYHFDSLGDPVAEKVTMPSSEREAYQKWSEERDTHLAERNHPSQWQKKYFMRATHSLDFKVIDGPDCLSQLH